MTIDALFDAAWNRRDRRVLPALQAWLDTSVVQADPDEVARACLGSARLWILDREYGLAGEVLDRGIAVRPTDDLNRLRLLNLRAYCFLEQGCVAEAVDPLLAVERTAGEHVAEARQAQVNLAFALLDLGDVDGARDGFDRLADGPTVRPWDRAFARYGTARCLLRAGALAGVEALLHQLRAESSPSDGRLTANADLLEALLADARGDRDGVHAPAERALAAFGNDANVECLEALVARSRACRLSGDPAAAAPFVDEALRRAPPGRHRGPVLREKALVEGALHHPAEAERAWREAYDSLAEAEAGSGRALRASSERAQADLQRVREIELTATHQALQRAYRSVEERVAERTAALQTEVTERRAAEGRALAANRSKNEFLANMSHELRTPLNAILGYGELVREDPDAGPFVRDLDAILGSARHLLSLVDDLLDVARVEAGRLPVHPAEVAVAELVAEIAGRVRPLVEASGNTFAVAIEPAVGRFVTDPVRLSQILQNLVSNAARHTRDGRVGLEVQARGDVLTFTVADTGVGIPPELLPRVFEPFVQGRGGGRAGLGLALVKHLCEALDGGVRLESEPGRGTRATVSLHAMRSPRSAQPR